MGANNHPTTVPENFEGGDDSTAYDLDEAVEYVEDAAPDAASIAKVDHHNNEFAIEWHGRNRKEVFTHLLEHGWVVTSVDNQWTWFDRVAGVEDLEVDA